jgi:uncharacterized membrane protein
LFAIVLGLGASASWGSSDFLGGMQARKMPLLRVLLISQTIAITALTIALVASGVAPPAFSRVALAIAAGVASTAALAAFYRALSIGTMSIVAPISATGVALPVIVGIAG